VTDGFKLAPIHISDRLNGLDSRNVHPRHDETIIEARDNIADQVQANVVESMEKALERIVPEVLFVVGTRGADL
jgi:DNA polymerase I-like protein with 3'-5' exonuclease and polymerase domains